MILELANKITEKMVKMDVIKDEIDIYKYGFAMLISYSISVCIVICISLLTNTFIYSLIYIISFDKLRSYGGGYHANSYFSCISLFVILYIVYIIMFSNISFIPLVILATFFLFLLKEKFPIEHPNKKISDKEKQIHSKRAKLRFVVALFLSVIFSKYLRLGNAMCSIIIIIEILCFLQLHLNKEEEIC